MHPIANVSCRVLGGPIYVNGVRTTTVFHANE